MLEPIEASSKDEKIDILTVFVRWKLNKKLKKNFFFLRSEKKVLGRRVSLGSVGKPETNHFFFGLMKEDNPNFFF